MRSSLALYLLLCFYSFFFFNDTATTEIYTLSLHDALPISLRAEGLTAEHRFGDQILRDPQHARGDDPSAPPLELAARLEVGHMAIERVGDGLDAFVARRRRGQDGRHPRLLRRGDQREHCAELGDDTVGAVAVGLVD